jgi:hypothetical protein
MLLKQKFLAKEELVKIAIKKIKAGGLHA